MTNGSTQEATPQSLHSSSIVNLSFASPPGFKDWALVCAALGQGRQSLILRKGGIAEGRAGFRFKHEEFFLFPTQYHEQARKVRPSELSELRNPAPAAPDEIIEVRFFFRLEWAVWLGDWAALPRLEPFHIWTEEAVRERFAYGAQSGLQCAFGRVYRLDPVWTFPDRPAYGGCRSWVTLPAPPEGTTFHPVLDDASHAGTAAGVRAALDAA